MRRLVVLLAFLALPASAQHSPFLWSTKSILELGAGLTDAGRFGAPGWATASLPTCDATNERAISYDLTTNTLKFCNGSAWGAIGTVYAVFTGATGIADGSTGLVPQPLIADQLKFLRGDSTWVTIPGGGNALTADPLSQFAATTSAQFAGVISDETGTGIVVLATTPTLVTPVLGIATATSINKVALTAPAAGSTLTIADGKTLTANATLTLAGTDGTTMTFPATTGTVATLNTANTFTAAGQTFSPATDAVAVTIRRNVGATANLLQIQDESNNPILYVGPTGIVLNPLVVAPATDAVPLVLRQNVGATTDLLAIQRSNNDPVLTVQADGNLLFEGTVDAHELTLAFADAGADATVTIPATSGTIALTADKLSAFAATTSAELAGVVSDETGSGVVVLGTSPTFTTNVTVNGASPVVFEGATADDFELTLAVTDPTTPDKTITFPDATGTVALLGTIALGTDTTGNYVSSATTDDGLELTGTEGGSLGVLLDATPADALSATVNSGSGLETLASGLTMIQGCTDTQVLAWDETNDYWECATADGGAGDVVGPASSTDTALARFDLATGKLLKGSDALLSDAEVLSGLTGISVKSTGSGTPAILEVPALTGTGTQNTVIGGSDGTGVAGASLTTGYDFTIVGVGAGRSNNVGAGNVYIGVKTGDSSVNGYDQTLVGTGADVAATNSSNLVAIGHDAVASTASTVIGYNASSGSNGGNIVIGASAVTTGTNVQVTGSVATPMTSSTTIRSTTGSADVQALTGEAAGAAITLAAATSTDSTANLAPANSVIDAISCRVTAGIVDNAAGWGVKVTGGTAFNIIGTATTTSTSQTAGNTVIWVPANYADQFNAAAAKITITHTDTPSAGAVRCFVHSRTFTPPTS